MSSESNNLFGTACDEVRASIAASNLGQLPVNYSLHYTRLSVWSVCQLPTWGKLGRLRGIGELLDLILD